MTQGLSWNLVLTVRALSKRFPAASSTAGGVVALDGIELDVADGAFACVLGASGSGKTTLLRCIAGFERPDAGTISLSGRVLAGPGIDVRPFDRGIGVVPQEGALFPHLTAAQNIAFGLPGPKRRVHDERVEQLLELTGLRGLGDRRPDQLSGGQQQRVALARALASGPRILLLDEPFSALDAQLRVALREEVRELLRRLGAAALLVTHDQAEAMSMADHLVLMREGRIVEAGDPRVVYEAPSDVESARFLGEALVIDGDIAGSPGPTTVDCVLGRLPVRHWHGAIGACRVLIRPEHLSIRRSERADVDGVRAEVEAHSYFGHDALVRVKIPNLGRSVAVRVPGDQDHRVGDRVVLCANGTVSTYSLQPAVS